MSCNIGTDQDLKTQESILRVIETGVNETSEYLMYDLWDCLLHHYTKGSLTYPSDKAIAVHSLALKICRHLGHDHRSAYVNGIWRARFIDGLLWISCSEGHHVPNGACSWSWLSMQGGVFSNYWHRETYKRLELGRHTTISELLDVQAECTLLVPTAAAGGFARVRGPLCKVILTVTTEESCNRFGTTSILVVPNILRVGGQSLVHDDEMEVRLDDSDCPPESDESERQLCLLLGRAVSLPDTSNSIAANVEAPYYGRREYECLLLEPVVSRPGYFRRVGYVRFAKRAYVWTLETPEDIRAIDNATCRLLDSQFRSLDVSDHHYHSVDDDFMYTITLI